MSKTITTSTYTQNEKGEYVCPECGITKNRKNTMFYHMKTHTGEKKYVCTEPGCEKAFVQKSGLTQHMRQIHPAPDAATAAHACPCCDHTAAIKSNLFIHIGRKHGADWIPAQCNNGLCTGCDRFFASPTAYFYHAVACFDSDAPVHIRVMIRGDGVSEDLAKSLCTLSRPNVTCESKCAC
jgi:hypothetical protein